MQAGRFGILLFGIGLLMAAQDDGKTPASRRPDHGVVPFPPSSAELPETSDDLALHMLLMPWRVEDTPLRKPSVRRLSDSWNRLLEEVRKDERHFSIKENTALDSILRQVQSGLISIGLVPPNASVRGSLAAARQLVPDMVALRGFFERKHRERPKEKQFKRLSAYAGALAEETRLQAPTVPARNAGR